MLNAIQTGGGDQSKCKMGNLTMACNSTFTMTSNLTSVLK